MEPQMQQAKELARLVIENLAPQEVDIIEYDRYFTEDPLPGPQESLPITRDLGSVYDASFLALSICLFIKAVFADAASAALKSQMEKLIKRLFGAESEPEHDKAIAPSSDEIDQVLKSIESFGEGGRISISKEHRQKIRDGFMKALSKKSKDILL